MDDLGVPLFSETAILCKISHTSNFIQDDLLLSPPFHLFFVHLFFVAFWPIRHEMTRFGIAEQLAGSDPALNKRRRLGAGAANFWVL